MKELAEIGAASAEETYTFLEDKFNHNITCFNNTSIRAGAIYDNGLSPREYVLVYLKPNLNDEWKVVDFIHKEDGVYDAIDAMNDLNYFLNHG